MAGDPNYSNVVLLLHGNGANGSTDITDETGKTVTRYGNVQISTAQSKFGGSSIAYDASGDGLSVPGSADFAFGTGDFTLEAWVYSTGNQSDSQGIISRWTAQWWFGIDYTAGGRLSFNPASGDYVPKDPDQFPFNQWVHCAATRQSGTLRLFTNGVKKWEGTRTNNYTNTTATVYVGSSYGTTNGEMVNGYLDEVRVTKGVARYTSNFSVPTEPFGGPYTPDTLADCLRPRQSNPFARTNRIYYQGL